MIYLIGSRQTVDAHARDHDYGPTDYTWIPNLMSARGRRLNSGDRVIGVGLLDSSHREAQHYLAHQLELGRIRRDTSTRQAP